MHRPHHPVRSAASLGVLREYVEYYNKSRSHQSLGGNWPAPRRVEAVGELLRKNYGAREVVYFKKPTHAKPAPDEMAEEIARRCDVVVEGLAY